MQVDNLKASVSTSSLFLNCMHIELQSFKYRLTAIMPQAAPPPHQWFDFQKFSMIFAPGVSNTLFCIHLNLKEISALKLKTMEQLYYIKSGFFRDFVIYTV